MLGDPYHFFTSYEEYQIYDTSENMVSSVEADLHFWRSMQN